MGQTSFGDLLGFEMDEHPDPGARRGTGVSLDLQAYVCVLQLPVSITPCWQGPRKAELWALQSPIQQRNEDFICQ